MAFYAGSESRAFSETPARPMDQFHPAFSVATQPARPVAFDGLAGFFHASGGETAVLLLSPWGYEELCSRKTFRILGEKLAAAGLSCLRFDYPGTGHSLGESAELDDDQAWRNAVRGALKQLEALANPRKIIVIGQGIGGALAGDLAQETDIDGLVLMAPVIQGRAYLRELTAWTAMTKPTFMVDASDGPEGGLMAAGFVLPAATANEFRSLNLTNDRMPRAGKILLVERPDHPGDAKLAAVLEAQGTRPDRIPFEDYGDYILDPTLSVVPAKAIRAITDWCAANFGLSRATAPATGNLPATLKGPDFEQTLVRFGPERMFFGALTKPAIKPARTPVLFLNSGHDHSIGWGRMITDFSRALARDGIPSLRMDLAGIGESRLWPGQSGQVLYTDRQLDDVGLAIDWLIGETGAEKVLLYGRCSGAYLAFVAAATDARVAGVFLVNPRRLVWDADEDIDAAIREPIQTLETYGRKIFDRETLGRIRSGDLSVAKAGSKLVRAFSRVADRKLAPVLRGLSKHYRLSGVVHQRMRALADRGVPVELVYSDGDRGLPELHGWFGADLGGLAAYRNAEFHRVAGADHNLTPLAPRGEVRETLRAFAARFRG
ncbi:MAG: alpha/beta fold hydrolase [Oricola sp.]